MKSYKYSLILFLGYIKRVLYIKRDIINLLRFGMQAPLTYQLFFVETKTISHVLKDKSKLSQADSGRVVDGSWDQNIIKLVDDQKYSTIYNVIAKNKSFTDPGELVKMYKNSKKYNDQKILKRYDNLEKARLNIEKTGRLSTQFELSSSNFRQKGGIVIHFGRNGDLIFAHAGYHRLALANFKQIKIIPVAIGAVHRQSIINGKFQEFILRSNALKEDYERLVINDQLKDKESQFINQSGADSRPD